MSPLKVEDIISLLRVEEPMAPLEAEGLISSLGVAESTKPDEQPSSDMGSQSAVLRLSFFPGAARTIEINRAGSKIGECMTVKIDYVRNDIQTK